MVHKLRTFIFKTIPLSGHDHIVLIIIDGQRVSYPIACWLYRFISEPKNVEGERNNNKKNENYFFLHKVNDVEYFEQYSPFIVSQIEQSRISGN